MAKGKIQIDINAKDVASAEMKKVGRSTETMGDKFKKLKIVVIAAAAAITAFVVKSLKDWADAGDEIAKMADRTGVAIESISTLKHVLTLSGASLSDFETATKKLSKAIVDAGDGLATYTRAFERLGINVEDLERMSVEDQFWTVSMALAEIEDVTIRTATAMDLFGRSGTNLMPMLLAGTDGIAAMREEAEKLGYVYTEETAQAAEDFNDALSTLNLAWGKLTSSLIEDLNLDEYLVDLDEVISKTGDWVAANTNLQQSFEDMVGWIKNVIRFVQIMIDKYKEIGEIVPWIMPEGFKPGFGLARPETYDPTGESWYNAQGRSTVNIYIAGNIMGTESAAREIAEIVEDKIAENTRQTSFSSVNSGYFPGNRSR